MITIKIDENNIVTGYSDGDGYIEGYVEVERIPKDFAPNKYIYIDGDYFINPDYVEPTIEPTNNEPSANEILDVLLGVNENE